MKSYFYKLVELLVLFIILPVSALFDYPLIIKFFLGTTGFVYVIYVLLKVEKNKFKINPNLNWKRFWQLTLIKFSLIIIATTFYVWFVDNENLFIVILNKPLLWLLLLFVYSIFSVYPQELVYRTFFFQRYKDLFFNTGGLIMINAMLFSLAHLLFKNGLVILITFFGGLLFAFTYNRSKSTLLVSIEHAIYGSWLFTVGMGAMLGFPT